MKRVIAVHMTFSRNCTLRSGEVISGITEMNGRRTCSSRNDDIINLDLDLALNLISMVDLALNTEHQITDTENMNKKACAF